MNRTRRLVIRVASVAAAAVVAAAGALGNAPFAARAASAPITVYAGTIGTLPVVAKFGLAAGEYEVAGATTFGEYFYQSNGVGIELAGKRSGDTTTYAELAADAQTLQQVPTRDVWTIASMTEGGVEGTWSNGKGTPLPIHLHAIGTMTADTTSSDNDPYERAILASPVTESPSVSSGGRAYTTVTDSRYHVTSVRVPAGTPAARAANVALDGLFAKRRLDVFQCLTPAGPMSHSYQERLTVASYTARQISLDIHTAYFCGGPYPTNDAADPATVDLSTGKVVDWDAALGKTGKAKIGAAYQAAYKKVSPDPACPAMIAEGGSNLDLTKYVGKQGFIVRAELPHVAEICNVEIAIPFATVRPLLSPANRGLLP